VITTVALNLNSGQWSIGYLSEGGDSKAKKCSNSKGQDPEKLQNSNEPPKEQFSQRKAEVRTANLQVSQKGEDLAAKGHKRRKRFLQKGTRRRINTKAEC
jgi:hypothetical protein